MAIIRTDPNQGKTVVALLVVLALTVGVMVHRVQSTQAANAGGIQIPIAVRPTEGNLQMGVVGRPDRNPFKKSDILQAALSSKSVAITALPQQAGISGAIPLPSVRQGIGPMSVEPMVLDTPNGAQDSQSAVPQTDLPTFVLMASVLTNGKSSAVLRIGDSQIKVVRVGDMADARFRLQSVTSDQAVLTDGTTKVIAKRGRIEDEKPTGL